MLFEIDLTDLIVSGDVETEIGIEFAIHYFFGFN